MTSYADLSKTLRESLDLRLPPIAVCVTDRVPDGVPPAEGTVPAGCAFWERAASGPFATSAKDHELCAIGVYTHNLAGASASQAPELETVLGVLNDLEYARPEDVAQIPVLERQPRYVVYSPLADTPLPPDVVLLFAQARQGLIITEATQQVEADALPALGRPACAIVPQAINSGRAALSLGCCGARAYLDALADDVALWALPGAKLGEYAGRIAALARANAILTQFHERRGRDIAAGGRPSYQESLSRLQD